MGVSQAVRNPQTYIVRTGRMYRTLLTDPGAFYDDHVGSRGIVSELAVVAFVGLLGVVGNYYAHGILVEQAQLANLPLTDEVRFQLWGNVAAPLVGALVLWVGLAAALYGVSWLYSTVGGFYETLKRSAWALVPLAFANLIHTIAIAWAATGFEFPDGAQMPSRVPEQQAAYVWSQAAGETAVVAATLVGIVFVAWAGYIAAHAIEGVRDLERDEALRVAAVPTIAYALYVAYGAIGSI